MEVAKNNNITNAEQRLVNYIRNELTIKDAKQLKSTAMYDLTTSALKGTHLATMSNDSLVQYNNTLGSLLRELPVYLDKNNNLTKAIYQRINSLDPNSSPDNWGRWCKNFAKTINQKLPDMPSLIVSNSNNSQRAA